ncbi:MAG: hypothetical protein JW939_03770 [Candidatus Thermoplasmatota archaeon]|nr:hypothetical protein [Candidatus Thermoplasmatota archaeon]
MRRSWSSTFLESFDHVFHDIKVEYQEAPFRYLSKWDIVSDLHSKLGDLSHLEEVETGRFTIGKDGRWRQKRSRTDTISTTPLHLGIGFEKDERQKADISFIDLRSMQFAVTARFGKKRPTSAASWRFSSGAGISVLLNLDVQYAKRKNTQTGRFSKTDGLKELEKEVLKELANLRMWDKSILLLVDNHSLYTRNDLEAAFSKKLKPYTMKMYYLSPRSGFFISGKRE